jgi:hypothetical protein
MIGMFIRARLTPYRLHAEKGYTSGRGVTRPDKFLERYPFQFIYLRLSHYAKDRLGTLFRVELWLLLLPQTYYYMRVHQLRPAPQDKVLWK